MNTGAMTELRVISIIVFKIFFRHYLNSRSSFVLPYHDTLLNGLSSFMSTPTTHMGVQKSNAFFFNITENFGVADAQTVTATFLQSIAENINPADVPTIQAAFLASIAENINMADNTQVAGWIKIIDDQTANWTLISNTETADWTVVSTTNNAGWTDINNLQ